MLVPDQIRALIDRFLNRCMNAPNFHKILTDVILDLNTFVLACRKLSEQPTVLQNIDLPQFDGRSQKALVRHQA